MDVELAFVCTGKKSISMESTKYFLNVSFVFGNVVGIDENVVKIYDDNDVDHICEDVIHKLLKSCLRIKKVSPSGITNHSKEHKRSPEGSLPFVSRCNPNEMVSMLEVNFGVDLCFSLVL